MKNFYCFTFTLLLSISVFNLKAQQVYFTEYQNLQDSVYYPLIDTLMEQNKLDSALNTAQKSFAHYAEKNELDRATFLINDSYYKLFGYKYYTDAIPSLVSFIDRYENKYDTANIHYAKLIETLAFAYKFFEKVDLSKPLYEKTIRITEKLNLENKQLIAQCYESYGSLMLYMGDAKTGYEYLRKALKLLEIYDNKYAIAHCYLELARATGITHQEKLSYDFNKKAIEILQKDFPHGFNHVVATSNHADNAFELEKYKEGLYWAHYADSVLHHYNYEEKLHMIYFSILANKGIGNRHLRNYDDANKHFQKLAQQIQKYYPSTPFIADAYQEIALNYDLWGQYDSAIAYYKRTIESNPQMHRAYDAIANCYLKIKKYDDANENIRIALKLLTKKELPLADKPYNSSDFVDEFNPIQSNITAADILYKKYKETQSLNDLRKATHYVLLSDTLFSSFLNTTLIGKADDIYSKRYHEFAQLSIAAFYDLYLKTQNNDYQEYAMYFINKAKAINLATEVNHTNLASVNPEIYKEQIELKKSMRFLENELQALKQTPDTIKEKEIEEELFQLQIKAFESSFAYMDNTNLKNKIITKTNLLNLSDYQKRIKANKAIISYYLTEETFYGYVLTEKKAELIKIEYEYSLTELIQSFYKSLKTGSNDLSRQSKELYRALIQPFAKSLKGIQSIVFIPDGNLASIPFELFLNENNKYLLEDYSIAYHYSIDLWYNNLPKNSNKKFLALAPVFNQKKYSLDEKNILRSDSILYSEYRDVVNGKELAPLIHSSTEVEEASKLFKNNGWKTKLLLNKEANENNLKNNSNAYAIIHLATHGYSSKREPDLSGLFLYGSPNKGVTNDGFLYAKEIYDLKLDSTDLIVLSACKTGAGQIVEGEGVLALPRGFIFAGTPNIIVSLWKIHDEKTKNLMLEFYKYVIKGKNYAEALRQAKLAMIKKGEGTIDWSGIVLIGN